MVTTRQDETRLQKDIVAWCSRYTGAFPELRELFHPANGEFRTTLVGAKLKAMGTKKGVPDLLLLVPRGGYHGFACELKTSTGMLSASQRGWKDILTRRGYYHCVVRSLEEWEVEITDYLKQRGDELS